MRLKLATSAVTFPFSFSTEQVRADIEAHSDELQLEIKQLQGKSLCLVTILLSANKVLKSSMTLTLILTLILTLSLSQPPDSTLTLSLLD